MGALSRRHGRAHNYEPDIPLRVPARAGAGPAERHHTIDFIIVSLMTVVE
jgi:hypothetical protein